eukprot:13786467-Alexandrium_andersonii.AAC.1
MRKRGGAIQCETVNPSGAQFRAQCMHTVACAFTPLVQLGGARIGTGAARRAMRAHSGAPEPVSADTWLKFALCLKGPARLPR